MNNRDQTPAYTPQIRLYQDWLREKRGLQFDSYDALWRWSTTELNDFWQSIWDYFDMQSPTPHKAALSKNAMPGGEWFVGAQSNYAAQMFRHVEPAHQAGFKAIISQNELGVVKELSWPELRRQVAPARQLRPFRLQFERHTQGRCTRYRTVPPTRSLPCADHRCPRNRRGRSLP